MNSRRTRTVAILLAVSALLVLAAVGGAVPGVLSVGPIGETTEADRADEPTTEDTVGYVEGYWYDDELDVDERDGAVVEDDELEAVVYRSMARVEEIRGLTFKDDVPVDVVSREEFEADNDGLFADVEGDERIQLNVNAEALFAVDRETDATEAQEALYGGTVGGYYEPATNQVVLVSDSAETPEVDEAILGHELLHALQDQQFDLSSYDRETVDQDNAKNGLIEGDAVWVETAYEQRCEAEWDCLEPGDDAGDPPDVNWVLYASIFQPYSDGPDYVDHLRDQNEDWTAVDAAYDDPPASTSEVIRPGEDREPAEIDVEDRSNESWSQLEIDGEPATETYGEAGMVSMFAGDAHDSDEPSVIGPDAFFEADLGGYDYDQPYTDGWAGDELVTYVADDVDTDDPAAAADRAGYVWETEWTSSDDAEQFLAGYEQQLELQEAEPVDDRQDTYVVDEAYSGAYYVDHDGETVTIVNAPSVEELAAVDDGAAPEGEDTIEIDDAPESEADDGAEATDDEDDSIPGFGAPATVVAAAIVVAVATAARVRSKR
ncbi:Hvo_1808 family surface protein [Natronococcus sp. A-GB7]|uniref:Hvo_1808 family surface protein n=1 Tax=Natronococcus sp. A-GB7 TaxID=3037649 RepID=UPI00241E57B8|nr:Hvo_1808 family surface protein [Natronococcus sp. A-GB7]MDG5821140.1 Hvo_1808 family surface protein [Natronococcus sp. A-GB7]